jgi:hypothetical protein
MFLDAYRGHTGSLGGMQREPADDDSYSCT